MRAIRQALLHGTLAVAILAVAGTATAAADTAAPLSTEPVEGQVPVSGQQPTGPTQPPAASQTQAPAPSPGVKRGDTLVAPSDEAQEGGAGEPTQPAEKNQKPKTNGAERPEASGGVTGAPPVTLSIPMIPSSTCAATGVPPILIPIYQRAAATYGLGPQGPAVLAGINAVETAFGTNLSVSSAGAEGWMQFIPSSWAIYGVDANGDGVKDPYNPEDAIFAAARYLSAAGMPTDTYGAIFSYNHADWYVAEVLSNAACYAQEVGDPSFSGSLLEPQMQVLSCEPAKPFRKQIPSQYLSAFEKTAARYELGQRGVWALAAVARMESNFGRGMTKRELNRAGPLGLEPNEWKRYAVDGGEDGHIRHRDPADSAATLAREIWSRGSLRAGLFAHNHAQWYVQAVFQEGDRMRGHCKVEYTAWKIAPLPAGLETTGPTAILAGNLASAPRSAPPAVKAAIAAANSISTTPYIWGGGHTSWISAGYDCSGAVSFALYGGGLLNRPLTSGELEHYGEAGPGRWITIYANATHAYAVIAGLRWDTVGDAQGSGPRWHTEPPYPEGFVVRHPTGY